MFASSNAFELNVYVNDPCVYCLHNYVNEVSLQVIVRELLVWPYLKNHNRLPKKLLKGYRANVQQECPLWVPNKKIEKKLPI